MDRLVDVETAQIEDTLRDLRPYQALATPSLWRVYDNSPDDSKAKLHAAMAISTVDDSVVDYLGQRLLTLTPQQFEPACDLLMPHRRNLIARYWQIVEDSEEDSLRQFQAACALASFDRDSRKWWEEQIANRVAGQLVDVLPVHLVA